MKKETIDKIKHAFSIEQEPLTKDELALLDRVAGFITQNRMQSAAILALQSLTPLSFIGSQAFIVISPFLDPFITVEEQARITKVLEHRDGIELLIQKIEERKS